MYTLIDGKKVSKLILEEVKKSVLKIDVDFKICIILVGDNPASKIYIKNKVKTCKDAGILVDVVNLSESIDEIELKNIIVEKNCDDSVHGILLQLPLPESLSKIDNSISSLIDPKKDVDGFSRFNLGALISGEKAILPATPQGIINLLSMYKINIVGATVTMVGASTIVGKPLAMALQNIGATVTICNSKTKDLKLKTKDADIICVAVGKESLITSDMVKNGSVVVDVGINRNSMGKLCGDVDFEAVSQKAGYITPVPGGVGPMTVVSILTNLLKLQGVEVDLSNINLD